MPAPEDLQCLERLANTANSTISAPEIISIKERIRNYGNFYYDRHDVPKVEIFYAAAVNARKLEEICRGVPNVKIYLAKTSSDNNNQSDFHFIIMPADKDGETIIDDPNKTINNDDYLDQVCCKNPPPNASDM